MCPSTRGEKRPSPLLVWSGHESGGTVIEAMNRLYQTSQQRVFLGTGVVHRFYAD
jgi:hypothetical protein